MFFLFILWLWGAGGCASYTGVYHTVQPGQTLYRISLAYGVPLEKLMRINRIEDPTQLKPGKKLFIPGARKVLEVPPSLPQEGSTASLSPSPSSPSPSSSPYPSGVSPPPPEPARSLFERRPRSITPESVPPSGDSLRLIWPLTGKIIRGFQLKAQDPHEGIDIDAERGAPIRAAEEGRVLYSDNRIRGYGNMVIIRHKGRWATIYAHNEKNLVKEGEFVRQGQVIALVGSSGRATGTHLHFEVRYGREPRDPLKYLPEQRAEQPRP